MHLPRSEGREYFLQKQEGCECQLTVYWMAIAHRFGGFRTKGRWTSLFYLMLVLVYFMG
jgi:hypothetical protein